MGLVDGDVADAVGEDCFQSGAAEVGRGRRRRHAQGQILGRCRGDGCRRRESGNG